MRFISILLTFFLIQLSWEAIQANEVIGCGGFIKSNTEINYKIIKIKLITKDGAVKYTSEASPVNGYYMIPVYNKGEYVLQVNPPPGWSFEPSQVNINVDGQSDPCSKNEDINFFFKGFGLSGKVVTQGDPKNNGPSGIKLKLISNNQVIDAALSGPDGSYYFSNVMPGSYQVEAEHPNMKFSTNKVNVIFSKENWFAKDPIVVSGFLIEGFVTTLDKSPVKDAVVELFFADDSYSKIDVKNFECDLSSKNGLRICHTKSDANGKFQFTNLAFAKYKLTALLSSGPGLTFTMQPEELRVDLARHQNELLNQAFVINSVTIKSKVLLSEKKVLDNGEISVDSQKYAIAKDGTFVFQKLTSGSHKVSIKSKNVYFEDKQIQIDLKNTNFLLADKSEFKTIQSLTRFVAESFDACGKITIIQESTKNSKDLANLPKSIQIRCFALQKDGSLKLSSSSGLDENLSYCLKLDAKVSYVLKAELTDNSLAKVLKLVPLERKVLLTDAPLFDVNFEQLEAKLEGRISLLGSSILNDLSIILKSDDPKQQWNTAINAKCQEEKVANQSSKVVCAFSLTNLLFGEYRLTTNYDDLFCWNSNGNTNYLTLTVDSELQKVNIVQTGYKLNYKLSHRNAMLKLIDQSKNVLLSKNVLNENDLSGQICLPRIADYTLQIDSCHMFSENNDNLIKVSAGLFKKGANLLQLNSNKHLLNVDISFKFENLDDKISLDQSDLLVQAKPAGSSDTVEQEIKFKLESENPNELVFRARAYLESERVFTLVAKSAKVLFETAQKEIQIDDQKCEKNHAQFDAKLGIFILVSVTPKDIDTIDVLLKQASDNSTLLTNTFSSAFDFKLGPLKAPYSLYTIELTKPGFLLAKTSASSNKNVYKLEFSAEKLGHLKVSVIDSKLKTSLGNVLLSLSSENRLFRQTTKTDVNGQASFENLKPSLYYLILMMQEYDFTPNSHPIKITDGHHMNLMVEANRVAYSCFGLVTSVNGQAETSSDILVEAFGVRSSASDLADNEACKTSRENSQLDEFGAYRIRNLKPHCIYELTAIRSRGNSENTTATAGSQLRIVPGAMQVAISEADVLNQNFIILTKFDRVDVSVAVSYRQQPSAEVSPCPPPLNYKLISNFARVKLFKTNQPNHVLQTLYTSANSIAYLNYLPREKAGSQQQYTMQVDLLMQSSVSPFAALTQQQQSQLQQQAVLDRVELNFYVDESTAHKHLIAKFDFDKKKSDAYTYDLKQQQYQNVYFTLPLFVLIVSLLLNSQKLQQRFNSLRNSVHLSGGLGNYIQGLLQKKSVAPVVTEQKSTKVSRFASKQHHQSNKDSDNETARSGQKSKNATPAATPVMAAKLATPPTPTTVAEPSKNDQSDNDNLSVDESDSVEGDYAILKNPVVTKRKAKKI